MPNKKYDLIKLLKEYNKKYKTECILSNDIEEATIDASSFIVSYTLQPGATLLKSGKNKLGDFTYYYIKHRPNITNLTLFIESKAEEKMNLKIEILPPTKIRYAYLYTNYYAVTGPLSSSCMRYKENQKSLNFYIKNNVKIVTVTDNRNKIHARALLWENVKSTILKKPFTYLDRVYSRSDTLLSLFSDLAKENNWKTYKQGKKEYYKDNLNITGLCHFPYTDTFRRLYYKDNLVAANDCCVKHKVKHHNHIQLMITGNGGYFPDLDPNRVKEKFTENYISKKDAVKITRYNGWILKTNIANISGDYYSTHDKSIIETKLDGWVLKENSVTEIFTNHTMSKDKAVEVAKYKGWVHESNIVNIRGKVYHKQDNEIVCYSGKWYHISECFINYDRKKRNAELAIKKFHFWINNEAFVPYPINFVTRKGNLIPKKYAIIAFDLIYTPLLDDIEYQEVYCTSTGRLIKLVTGEFIVDSTKNREYLKRFNNKYYIKQDFKLTDKNQLKFAFMEK